MFPRSASPMRRGAQLWRGAAPCRSSDASVATSALWRTGDEDVPETIPASGRRDDVMYDRREGAK